MKIPRPRSLNGLILVGFGLVGLPLLVAVLWALFSLDRLAEQSETLVFTGVRAAENNRLLVEHLGSLERVTRQYQVLRNADSLQLMQQDLTAFHARLTEMAPLTAKANAEPLAAAIGAGADRVVKALAGSKPTPGEADMLQAEFAQLRQQVGELTKTLSAYCRRRAQAPAGQHAPRAAGLRLAGRRAGARDADPGTVLHFPRRQADPADRRRDPPARPERVRQAHRRQGPERPGTARQAARMAAPAPAGARPGEEQVPAPHVARAEDTARQHPRGYRTAARRHRRRTGPAAARSDRHPAHERPQAAAIDREPAELQRLADQDGSAHAERLPAAHAHHVGGQGAAAGAEGDPRSRSGSMSTTSS